MKIITPIFGFGAFVLALWSGATQGESLIMIALIFIFSALVDIKDAILGADE